MPTIESVPLIKSALAGDRQAFGRLISQYAGLVTGVAYSVCGNFDRSEDIGQEAFLEAWKSLSTLREPEKFSSWVCTIARRRAIDEVRRSNSKPASSLPVDTPDTKNLSPETLMSNAEDQALIWNMLERLPTIYRETLVLFYRGEQSVAEVAMALSESEAAIRQRLKRGRELLRSETNEVLANALRSSTPTASFSAAVIALIPASNLVATAAGPIGAGTGKTAMASGTAATIGSTALGPLIGIVGGVFGSWMSWRNAEFKSQQRFIVRSSIVYGVGLLVFMLLLLALVAFKLNNTLSVQAYLPLFVLLLVSAFFLNSNWMSRTKIGLKRLEREAQEAREPSRPEVAAKYAAFRDQARLAGVDETISSEAFQWNGGAWLGTTLGGIGWMVAFAFVLAMHGDWKAAAIVSVCAALASIGSIVLWTLRTRIKALSAIHCMILILGILTAIIFATVSLLASASTMTALHWSPWVWGLLVLFPLMSLNFQNIQWQTKKTLRKH